MQNLPDLVNFGGGADKHEITVNTRIDCDTRQQEGNSNSPMIRVLSSKQNVEKGQHKNNLARNVQSQN